MASVIFFCSASGRTRLMPFDQVLFADFVALRPGGQIAPHAGERDDASGSRNRPTALMPLVMIVGAKVPILFVVPAADEAVAAGDGAGQAIFLQDRANRSAGTARPISCPAPRHGGPDLRSASA